MNQDNQGIVRGIEDGHGDKLSQPQEQKVSLAQQRQKTFPTRGGCSHRFHSSIYLLAPVYVSGGEIPVSEACERISRVRRSTSERGRRTRRPHWTQRKPISAPRRITSHS